MRRLTLLLITIIFVQSAYSQWTQLNGPVRGEVQSVLPKDNYLFAGTNVGIYRSSDRGGNWVFAGSGLSGKPVKYLAVYNGVIYAGLTDGFYSEVFSSGNNGNTWNSITGGLNDKIITGLAVNSSFIIVSTTNGIFRSGNNGSNWLASNTGISSTMINSLCVSGNTLCAGTDNGVSLSTNNGNSWIAYSNEITGMNVRSVAKKDDYIFAAASYSQNYVSTNNGINWSNLSNGLAGNVSVFFTDGQNVYAGMMYYSALFFKSTNYGASWIRGDTVIKNGYVNSIISDGTYLYTGTSFGFFSSVNGLNWTPGNNGMRSQTVGSILFSGNKIYTGGEAGGFNISTDDGATWTARYSPTGTGITTKLMTAGNYIISNVNYNLYSVSSAMYRTSDEGLNWTSINQNYYNFLIGVNNNILYANSWALRLYSSTDFGSTWTLFSSVADYGTAKSILFLDNMRITVGSTRGVFYTSNNGQNWISTGLSNREVSNVIFNGSYYFAASTGGIFRSNDIISGWSQCGSADRIVYDVLAVNGKIITATDIGILVSFDNGENWTVKNQGFTITPRVNCLQVKGDYIYAGTSGQSLWKVPLSDIIGIRNLSSEVPASFSLYQNYPNPFNPVTKIRFDIPENGKWKSENGVVTLKVYDILGKEVTTLVNERLQPGIYETAWDASGFGSGVYFYKLSAGECVLSARKMILLK
ncbi:MAG: T9SS type A sorting domain-containing protein [Bacteroidetes bacterium]|nr:T9SS type A sorting domain-containing protein [Bacteroidota bacterium]